MFPLKDTIPSQTFPFVNIFLIIIKSVLFLFEVSLDPRELQAFLQQFGVIPAKFFWMAKNEPTNITGRYFPLLTSMFLHGGWFHIIRINIFPGKINNKEGVINELPGLSIDALY